jgi:general secretion pathway protein I
MANTIFTAMGRKEWGTMGRPSRQSQTGSDENSAGFTLLEVLVALTILSISLAALLGVFGESLQRDQSIQRRMAARTLAQSLLAEAEADQTLTVGRKSGSDDRGLQWSVAVTGQPLAQVTVLVRWTNASQPQMLRLTTLRMIEPAS